MRAAAEVGEITLRVRCDMAVLKFGDKFTLIYFAAIAEQFQGVGFGYIGAYNVFFLLGKLEHFFSIFPKSAEVNWFSRIDVVVESVLDSRTDTEFHSGIKFLQSFGKEVSRTVPESVFAFGIVPFEQFEFGVVTDGARQIPFVAVDRRRKDFAGKTGAYGFGNLKRSHSASNCLTLLSGNVI